MCWIMWTKYFKLEFVCEILKAYFTVIHVLKWKVQTFIFIIACGSRFGSYALLVLFITIKKQHCVVHLVKRIFFVNSVVQLIFYPLLCCFFFFLIKTQVGKDDVFLSQLQLVYGSLKQHNTHHHKIEYEHMCACVTRLQRDFWKPKRLTWQKEQDNILYTVLRNFLHPIFFIRLV